MLALMLLCTGLFSGAVAEEISPRSSNYFNSYGISVGRPGNGILSITFDATGMGLCSQLGVASYLVQKKTDAGWVDVSDLLDGSLGSNVVSYTFGRYFYGVAGETYRVKATFFCLLNGGVEFKKCTSAPITVR